MIPVEVLERVAVSDGEMVLSRRKNDYAIRVRGVELMNSRSHSSEDELGKQTCERIARFEKPHILVGGLGMGFTLRAALDVLPANATVDLVEIMPAVLRWNREIYGALANHPLSDPRVTAIEGDVAQVIAAAAVEQRGYHAILLDVDNGPDAVLQGNDALYKREGLQRAHDALAPDGMLAVWSAFESPTFTRWLRSTGFIVDTTTIRTRDSKGSHHHIWFARRGPR